MPRPYKANNFAAKWEVHVGDETAKHLPLILPGILS
jgi:hypothetical protein